MEEGSHLWLPKKWQRKYSRALEEVFAAKTGDKVGSFKDVISIIIKKVEISASGHGVSKCAVKRRAIKIGKCPRCLRVSPGFYYTTRCDGKTCTPKLSVSNRVHEFVYYGNVI